MSSLSQIPQFVSASGPSWTVYPLGCNVFGDPEIKMLRKHGHGMTIFCIYQNIVLIYCYTFIYSVYNL